MDETVLVNETNYVRNLLKGKIVEVIFQQMFSYTQEFRVTPIGHEYSDPMLMDLRYNKHKHLLSRIAENLENAPDFLLLSNEDETVYMVDVKYRRTINEREVLKIAEDIHEHWESAWLFLATQNGFYFQPASEIVKSGGHITLLQERWKKHIVPEVVQKYLQILSEFIRVDDIPLD